MPNYARKRRRKMHFRPLFGGFKRDTFPRHANVNENGVSAHFPDFKVMIFLSREKRDSRTDKIFNFILLPSSPLDHFFLPSNDHLFSGELKQKFWKSINVLRAMILMVS